MSSYANDRAPGQPACSGRRRRVRHTLRRPFAWILLPVIWFTLWALGGSATAQPKPTLSGRWSATAMNVQWRMGEWSSQCGPKPGGGGAAGGSVSIKQSGGELVIYGGTRTFRTTECWEQFPGLAPRAHTGGSRGWRTTCKTGANDPRQATVITTISASDDSISFDETGQYQFVIEGANCTASVRRTRSFRLIQREGEAPPAAPSASAPPKPAPEPAPAPAPARCVEPGPVARLEVRPGRKLIRPGDDFQFRASVVDAEGCPTGLTPRWSLPDGVAVKLVGPGKVQVDSGAAEGDVKLTANIGGRSVEVVLEIASKERYEALLAAGEFDSSGERGEVIAALASTEVGSQEVTSVSQGSRSWAWFAGLGALAGLLLLTGVVFGLRSRSKGSRASLALADDAAPHSYPQGNYTGSDQAAAAPGAQISPAPAPPRRKTICPTCGQIYEDEARFCGNDQTQLVPMN